MKFYHTSNEHLNPGTILKNNYGKIIQDQRFYTYNDLNYAQYLKEILFEELRKQNHSKKPSRLKAIYLFDDMETAKHYMKQHDKNYLYNVEIKQIKSQMRADMKWLDYANRKSINELMEIANNYFMEKGSDNSQWEILIDGIVVVKSELKN